MIYPKISVIMPVYNGENFINIAIKSILYQTYKDFEFLILDDASNDKTLKEIKSLGTKNKIFILRKIWD